MKFSSAIVQYIYMRLSPFISDQYYHVYNRGVDKRTVFLRYGHYRRFLTTINTILNTGSATPRLIYNQSLALKLKIKIVAYCLMPNHYHFLMKQLEDDGITQFMHKLDTSYTKYINLNLHRTGRLFENTFKAKRMETDEMFLHVARYIHLNPVIAQLVPSLELWPWSSYLETIGKREPTFCDVRDILRYFPDATPQKTYEQFVINQRTYAQLLHDAEKIKDEDKLFL